jgi:hypothetical protein
MWSLAVNLAINPRGTSTGNYGMFSKIFIVKRDLIKYKNG